MAHCRGGFHPGFSARSRKFPSGGQSRWQDDIITREIQPGARVLDLGCGDGQLLERLQRERQVRGQGVEIDAKAALGATERGCRSCRLI